MTPQDHHLCLCIRLFQWDLDWFAGVGGRHLLNESLSHVPLCTRGLKKKKDLRHSSLSMILVEQQEFDDSVEDSREEGDCPFLESIRGFLTSIQKTAITRSNTKARG